MNHLAHCFLSFGDEDLLLGNFIGDFVKGRDWENYPRPVQRGILLHRAIDSYTDNHALTDRSVARIRTLARRYAPPFVDILYDHLLAIHWEKHSPEAFQAFAQKNIHAARKSRRRNAAHFARTPAKNDRWTISPWLYPSRGT